MIELIDLTQIIIYLVLGIGLLLLGKHAYNLFSSYSLDQELTVADNPAVGTALAGFLTGLAIIIAAVMYDAREDLIKGFIDVSYFTLLGIAYLTLARVITDRLVLHRFEINKELIEDRNIGTGAVLFGNYVGAGLVVAAVLTGEAGKPFGNAFDIFNKQIAELITGTIMSFIFFLLGQAGFLLYGFIYSKITSYDHHAEIENDNTAAGVAYGGGLISLGLVMFKALMGNFTTWADSLMQFGIVLGLALIALPLVRLAVDKVMLSGANLAQEIATDRNVNAAYIEAICMIAAGGIILVSF